MYTVHKLPGRRAFLGILTLQMLLQPLVSSDGPSRCLQICSAVAGNQRLERGHEASLTTCLEVPSLGVCSSLEWRAAWFGRYCQSGSKAKRAWERGSAGWGKGGGKESLLLPGCCFARPRSVPKRLKREGN